MRSWTGQRARERANCSSALHVPPPANTKKEEDKAGRRLIYSLGFIWPSGWVWHGGDGSYYLQMICGVYGVLGIFLIAAAGTRLKTGA